MAASCSDDDEAVDAIDEYGDIKLVVTYKGDLENGNITLISGSVPAINKVTYLNNETQYELGPTLETMDDTKVHSMETIDSSGLNVLVEITSTPYEKTAQEYTLQYYFNNQLVAEKSVKRDVYSLSHYWSWDTQDGLVELNLVDVELE